MGFYCVASTGDFGHTEAYVATPADDGYQLQLVWEQVNNLEDNGWEDPSGMIFGKESNAYYGGFYNWDEYSVMTNCKRYIDFSLVSIQVSLSFRCATDVKYDSWYSGHGGLRDKSQLTCAKYESNEWPQGYSGRNQDPLPAHHLQVTLPDLNYEYVSTAPEIRQQNVGVGSIEWTADIYLNKYPLINQKTLESGLRASTEHLRTTHSLFFCPQTSEFPNEATPGYYTHGSPDGMQQTSQTLCEPGYYCEAGVRHPCQPGYYGDQTGLTQPTCNGFCPPGYRCPEGTAVPEPCPSGSYSVAGSYACTECAIPSRASCTTSRSCCDDESI